MPVEPGIAQMLAAVNAAGGPPLEKLSPAAVRETIGGFLLWQAPPETVASVDAVHYPGAVGNLSARIYTPHDAVDGRPVLIFFHGGGWMSGSLDLNDGPCRTLANVTGATVVSPAYRLAPEHPFPAGPDDAYAALAWVAENARAWGCNPERLIVGGESAGAVLAATISVRSRDEGGPPIAGQALVYPATDPMADTASRRDFGDGFLISAAAIAWMWRLYIGDGEMAKAAIPDKVADLAGLPPTLVVTMEYDVLRDEGEAYAGRLRDAGVDIELRRIDGLIHAALTMSALAPKVSEIHDAVGSFVKRRFASPGN